MTLKVIGHSLVHVFKSEFVIAFIGVSVISFKFSLLSYSLYHAHPEETLNLYVVTSLFIILIAWGVLFSLIVSLWRRKREEDDVSSREFHAATVQHTGLPGAKIATAANKKVNHRFALRRIALGFISSGACIISLSVLHVSLSPVYWLIISGSSLLGLVVPVIFFVALFAPNAEQQEKIFEEFNEKIDEMAWDDIIHGPM